MHWTPISTWLAIVYLDRRRWTLSFRKLIKISRYGREWRVFLDWLLLVSDLGFNCRGILLSDPIILQILMRFSCYFAAPGGVFVRKDWATLQRAKNLCWEEKKFVLSPEYILWLILGTDCGTSILLCPRTLIPPLVQRREIRWLRFAVVEEGRRVWFLRRGEWMSRWCVLPVVILMNKKNKISL